MGSQLHAKQPGTAQEKGGQLQIIYNLNSPGCTFLLTFHVENAVFPNILKSWHETIDWQYQYYILFSIQTDMHQEAWEEFKVFGLD